MANDNKIATAELLFMSAQKMGLQPQWLVKNGLFTITTENGEQYVSQAKSPLNSQIHAGLAKNKFHTRLILERHGLLNIPYARPRTLEEATDFLELHKEIIAKPVRGQGSQDIHHITDVSQLDGMVVRRYLFEKYILGIEMRYLVLNDQVIAVHRSNYGSSVAEDRFLERISFASAEWDHELVAITRQVSQILSLNFAAVDFMITADGQAYILEVNTAPGLKWFHAPTSGPSVDVASLFLRAMTNA